MDSLAQEKYIQCLLYIEFNVGELSREQNVLTALTFEGTGSVDQFNLTGATPPAAPLWPGRNATSPPLWKHNNSAYRPQDEPGDGNGLD